MVLPYGAMAQAQVDELLAPSVTVTGSPSPGGQVLPYPGGLVARGGQLGLLGNVDFMDAPFNQTSYTAGFIEDLQASTLGDLLESDPSVRLGTAPANFQQVFSIRGFLFDSEDVAFNGMYGLTPRWRVPVEMAERVEVLKGPSAVLTGMPPNGSTGGTVNILPKRAAAAALTSLTASSLSDSQAGAHLDLGRRFGADQAVGARLNAVYRNGATTVADNEQEQALTALGLDYQGERLRASLDLLYQHQQVENVVRYFATAPTLDRIPPPPASGLNYPGYGRLKATDTVATARIEYDLAESLTLFAAAGSSRYDGDLISAPGVLLLSADGTFTSLPGWQILEVDNVSFEAGAHAAFETGSVRHRFAAIVSQLEQRQDTFLQLPLEAPRFNNLYSPVPQSQPSVAGITPAVGKYQESTLASYAVADTLSVLDGRLQLTLGARYQSVEVQAYDPFTHLPAGDQYDESAVTPMVGLVIKPLPNLSLYASYVEGLAKGPSALPPAVTVATVLPPIRARQAEAGAKYDWRTFATTLSAFQITRPSATTEGNVLAENGEQRNRGIELNVFGEVARDVRILGGATFMRGQLTRTPGGAYDGNDAIGVPRMQGSLGVDWDNVVTRGFGLGARVIYTGAQYVDQANRFRIPAWTRVDVGARYVTRLVGKPLTLRLNVDNVFDTAYWGASNALPNGDASGGFLYVSEGPTVSLSATMDFSGSRSSP
jgi:iron complex outermembrane receptor protein